MSSSSPRVTIGVPVYNGERFIRPTLDSLLSQTYGDFELIIADNASTDAQEQNLDNQADQVRAEGENKAKDVRTNDPDTNLANGM